MEACIESGHQRCGGDEDEEDVSADESVQVILLNPDEPVREEVEGDDDSGHDGEDHKSGDEEQNEIKNMQNEIKRICSEACFVDCSVIMRLIRADRHSVS